ncbi:unnamed protein product [Schistocephalus solidus]|uniref:Integrase catalytic domain-containing protein n=1 Tax=Schistocephalus solidus TaxID=70667 RepID=A0A183TH11_SCHSO|nr:unnamed protein product [Schistocephalus solidus]
MVKWLEVLEVKTATENTAVRELGELIARYAIPTEILPDNGTQCRTSLSQQFCRDEEFTTGHYHLFTVNQLAKLNGLSPPSRER